MEVVAWIVISILFVIAFLGLIYPIIPSVFFIFAGFIAYGLFFSFQDVPWWIWLVEILFVILLFGADTLSTIIGVKKFGGTKAGLWGSTIGLIIGPFVIPMFGVIVGPFIGAVIGELIIAPKAFKHACKSGIGSVIGFLTSIVTKGIIQIIMIILFFVRI